MFGGGLSLEANAKLYILKNTIVKIGYNLDTNATIFTANSAEYGGAVYVDDDTNSGCASDPKTECFFQVLAMYDIDVVYDPGLVTKSLYFSKNYANISGSTLYGGLLDRCPLNPFAEIDNRESFAGITYFKNVSTVKHNIISIFSKPVRVCLCTKNLSVNVHRCSIHQSRIDVKKGETFIETYNTPYTPKHRYWTGLLLIARVASYLAAAANVSNNPTIALTSISFVVGSIFCLKGFTMGKQYKMWSKDVLETFFLLNILIFATLKWYSLDNDNKYQEAIAYTSVTITIILLLLIILYHVYTYTSLFSRMKETKLGRRMDQLFTDTDPKLQPRVRQLTPPTDDHIHRFDDRNLLDELDGPVYTGDYDTVPLINSVRIQPTYSVVEVHQPCHGVPPPPKGPNNAQNRPDDSN